jgi:hypothetical protein
VHVLGRIRLSGYFDVGCNEEIQRRTGLRRKKHQIAADAERDAVRGRQKASSPGRTRTYDPAVNSRLLYQLSYRGMEFFKLLQGSRAGKVRAAFAKEPGDW